MHGTSKKSAARAGGIAALAEIPGKDSQGKISEVAQRAGELAHQLFLVAEHPLRIRHDALAFGGDILRKLLLRVSSGYLTPVPVRF